MIGFFSLLIGYLVFTIVTYHNANKTWKQEEDYRKENKQYAVKNNKPVWFHGYYKNKEIFTETRSNREVFQGIDKNGLKRWYYTDNKKPMQYIEDKRIINSLNTNKTIASINDKKWCEAENFWDDSIINYKGTKIISPTYLDDYGISNLLNQRVYLKNMRPYQLYLLGTSETEHDYFPLIKKQYLIRFGKSWFFNFKTQHCISDKQLNSKQGFWSKWYAITEEEYFNLIDKNEKKSLFNQFKTESCLKRLKPIKMEDIAFQEGNENYNWELADCGIKKAFDNEGNFIGEQL